MRFPPKPPQRRDCQKYAAARARARPPQTRAPRARATRTHSRHPIQPTHVTAKATKMYNNSLSTVMKCLLNIFIKVVYSACLDDCSRNILAQCVCILWHNLKLYFKSLVCFAVYSSVSTVCQLFYGIVSIREHLARRDWARLAHFAGVWPSSPVAGAAALRLSAGASALQMSKHRSKKRRQLPPAKQCSCGLARGQAARTTTSQDFTTSAQPQDDALSALLGRGQHAPLTTG